MEQKCKTFSVQRGHTLSSHSYRAPRRESVRPSYLPHGTVSLRSSSSDGWGLQRVGRHMVAAVAIHPPIGKGFRRHVTRSPAQQPHCSHPGASTGQIKRMEFTVSNPYRVAMRKARRYKLLIQGWKKVSYCTSTTLLPPYPVGWAISGTAAARDACGACGPTQHSTLCTRHPYRSTFSWRRLTTSSAALAHSEVRYIHLLLPTPVKDIHIEAMLAPSR